MSTKTETKDTSPKTDPATAQHPFSAFDPMAAWTATQQAWHEIMTDAYGRAQAFADEYAAIEAQVCARAQAAVDTWAQLARDTIAYGAQLSAQARKLGVEAARKAGIGA